MTRVFTLTAIFALAVASCSDRAADAPASCSCSPHAPSSRASAALLELVHRHAHAVRDGQRNGRDTKLIDDELRMQSQILCEPCGAWIGERTTPEEIYPFAREAEAVGVVCTGLQLGDGTIAYGELHPPECR
jgi:hypothetical protein